MAGPGRGVKVVAEEVKSTLELERVIKAPVKTPCAPR
jgi:hypothetical protein